MERYTSQRSDSWTPEEDQSVVKTVLSCLEDGKTQLDAFVLASVKIGRTPAAVGYRWNGVLRKNYQDEIEKIRNGRIYKRWNTTRRQGSDFLDQARIALTPEEYALFNVLVNKIVRVSVETSL